MAFPELEENVILFRKSYNLVMCVYFHCSHFKGKVEGDLKLCDGGGMKACDWRT